MKLLSITLDGEYKGLRSDTFDFSQSEGRLLAFIGLNGSGKSQLLELIGETFSYLERYKRDDFKVRRPLGFSVSVIYQINIENDPDVLSYSDEMIGADNHEPMLKVTVIDKDSVNISVKKDDGWQSLNLNERYFPIPNIVGYSSGLNENLQRSFMKNSVQFYDIMRVRKNRRKLLEGDIKEHDVLEINKRYLKQYPNIFSVKDNSEVEEDSFLSLNEFDLGEPVTDIPKNLFLDYDCCALLMTSFAMLPDEEINTLLKEVRFKLPKLIKLKYDLRRGLATVDAVKDIAILIRAGGEDCVEGIGNRTTDKEYDLYELDYLAGFITLDLSNRSVKEKLSNANYNEPLRLFERLYKIQLLGVSNWQGDDLKKLRKCDFIETVKKPLKTKLPLSVERLELADENGHCVNFDDFSDGEAQLIQILAAARIFRDEQTLFLFDEPETHLNPSWRTFFHQHLTQANQVGDTWTNSTQTLLSTHSPFMISSLKKSDVYRFERNDDGFIRMAPATEQTYGASFDVLIKQYFGLKSLISQSVISEIREKLKLSDEEALAWINENLGMSPEKAYFQRKLSK